jgi:hypothetical protein
MKHFSLGFFVVGSFLLSACSGLAVPQAGTPQTHTAARPPQTHTAARPPLTLSIGSLDSTRGGIESLQSSTEATMVAAIKKHFPGSKLHFTDTLTAKFLGSLNLIVIGVAYSENQGITPLSPQEQTALVNFVKAGGTATLFADNDIQFQAASDSILNPFGLSSTGYISGNQAAKFVHPKHNPIMSGPEGTAKALNTWWPAWFNNLGSSIELAKLTSNGQPAAAYFPSGALRAGSGAVVFFSDSILIDQFRTRDDQIAILNAFALTP